MLETNKSKRFENFSKALAIQITCLIHPTGIIIRGLEGESRKTASESRWNLSF